jgi:DsbC/DsbD-like thiol-disulfide interchange protein
MTRAASLWLGLLAAAMHAPPARSADAPASLALDGVDLRLVADAPAPDGRIRAALLVDLAPGWKTYWRDPGEAGIPPRLDLSGSVNLAATGTDFPMPHRFGDAYGSSNGYSQPFAVALTFERQDAAAPAAIELGLSLGLCREICIPAVARLRLVIGPGEPADTRLVAYAFDALPEPSTPAAGIVSARLSPDGMSIAIEATAPDDREVRHADLFVAGPDGWFFGTPKAPRRDGRRLIFEIPINERPRSAKDAPPAEIEAVLDLGAHAYRVENLAVAAAR